MLNNLPKKPLEVSKERKLSVCINSNGFSFLTGLKISKQISLTQGKFAIVDDEDYEWLNQYKWFAVKSKNTYYACRSVGKYLKQYRVFMHRQILGLKRGDGKQTDHHNHYGLDNRRYNIRICTNSQNSQNRLLAGGTSQFKGVHWSKIAKKWHSKIYQNGKLIHIGYFADEIEAAKAYDKKAKELFDKFANVNF